jgi:hypothetical protein
MRFIKIEFRCLRRRCRPTIQSDTFRNAYSRNPLTDEIDLIPESAFFTRQLPRPASPCEAKRLQFGWLNALSAANEGSKPSVCAITNSFSFLLFSASIVFNNRRLMTRAFAPPDDSLRGGGAEEEENLFACFRWSEGRVMSHNFTQTFLDSLAFVSTRDHGKIPQVVVIRRGISERPFRGALLFMHACRRKRQNRDQVSWLAKS